MFRLFDDAFRRVGPKDLRFGYGACRELGLDIARIPEIPVIERHNEQYDANQGPVSAARDTTAAAVDTPG